MKRRNRRFGCPRIAQEIAHTFGVDINKDVVRRVLAKHYRPGSGNGGPSWLTVIGHVKDSLWSIDMFRCESILLKSYWVLVLMDVFTRRVIGFGVERADIDGLSVCRMFNKAKSGIRLPRYLSSDHDPLFTFHRWQANLRVLNIEEIKSIPYLPVSHPFIERLIGTIGASILTRCSFGTSSTCSASWTTSRRITTSIAFTPRSTAKHRTSKAVVLPPNRPTCATSLGGRIVMACTRSHAA